MLAPHDDITQERVLWLTVIRRAQEEADGGNYYIGNARIVRFQAQRWLTNDRFAAGQFERVCELAGMNDRQTTKLRTAMIAKYGIVGRRGAREKAA